MSNSQIAKPIKEKKSLGGFDDESYQEEEKTSQRKKSVTQQKEPAHGRLGYSSNGKSI